MFRTLFILFLLTGAIGDCIDHRPGSFNTTNAYALKSGNDQIHEKTGISINLYRLPRAEKLDEVKNLEEQIARTRDTRVNLYKIAAQLAVIFLNATEPFDSTQTIPYKMLYGRKAKGSVDVGEIGGFLPSSEIPGIVKWIKDNKIETFAGFSDMYDNLSPAVKKELEEMGSDDKLSLFNGYVRPLTVLYFTAYEKQNSVIFIGQ